jgi:hypothetical protein
LRPADKFRHSIDAYSELHLEVIVMRSVTRFLFVCICIASTSAVAAPPARRAPPPSVKPSAAYDDAQKLINAGNYDQALTIIGAALAATPMDLAWLELKGLALFKQRSYLEALAAYEAYVAAGATGANRRAALKIIDNLLPARTTSIEVTVANGPADIYLDTRAQGAVCAATTACTKAWVPRKLPVIAERPGFERWAEAVTVTAGTVTKVAVALVEKPSLLTVRVAQQGARILVDDTEYTAPLSVPAGPHTVVVSLPGHAAARLDAAAREGKPINLDVALSRLTPVRIEPATATVLVDDKPAVIQDGGIALPAGAKEVSAQAPGYDSLKLALAAGRDPGEPLDLVLSVYVKPKPAPPNGPWTRRRKIALGVGGLGVAALAGGIVFGLQARQADKDAFALCPSPTTPCASAAAADDLNARGRSRALTANVAFGVASAAAVTAAILWFTGKPESPESPVAVSARFDHGAGIDVAVRF